MPLDTVYARQEIRAATMPGPLALLTEDEWGYVWGKGRMTSYL